MKRTALLSLLPAIGLVAFLTRGIAGEAIPNANATQPDQDFVKEAAEVNAFESEAGEIAMKQSSNPDVTSYAQMVARDSSKANGELMALAGRKSIDISRPLTTNDQGVLRRLAGLKGADFDQNYAQAVAVGVHIQAVSDFKVESTTGSDPDIKAWAVRTLPTLQQHLQLAQHLRAITGNAEE